MAHMAQVANSESERTVVIVEDDPNIADLVDLYLREAGFRVLQGATGATQSLGGLVMQQAAMLGYLDDFWLMAIVTVASAPTQVALAAWTR